MRTRTIHLKSNEMLDICFEGKRVLLVAISDDQESVQIGEIAVGKGYDNRACTREYLQTMLKEKLT